MNSNELEALIKQWPCLKFVSLHTKTRVVSSWMDNWMQTWVAWRNGAGMCWLYDGTRTESLKFSVFILQPPAFPVKPLLWHTALVENWPGFTGEEPVLYMAGSLSLPFCQRGIWGQKSHRNFHLPLLLFYFQVLHFYIPGFKAERHLFIQIDKNLRCAFRIGSQNIPDILNH
jgi:hypothetical protein